MSLKNAVGLAEMTSVCWHHNKKRSKMEYPRAASDLYSVYKISRNLREEFIKTWQSLGQERLVNGGPADFTLCLAIGRMLHCTVINPNGVM